MDKFMSSILGASWRTGLTGYGEAVLLYVIAYIKDDNPLPTTKEGWVLFAGAILRVIFAYNTKDKQVTNSSIISTIPAHTVSEAVSAVSPGPAK